MYVCKQNCLVRNLISLQYLQHVSEIRYAQVCVGNSASHSLVPPPYSYIGLCVPRGILSDRCLLPNAN